MKRLAPIVLVVLLALMPLAAFAQGGPSPICNGLSEADCAILTGWQGNLAGVTSLTVPAWSLEFEFNMQPEATAVVASGSAGFMWTGGAEDFLVDLKVDSLSVTPTPTEPLPSSFEYVMNSTMGYVFYNGEWYGEAITADDLAEIQDLLNTIQGGGTGESMDLAELGIDLTGVVMTTRGADADSMGEPVATFTSQLDLTKLLTAVLSSPMVAELVGSSMGEDASTPMTPEQLQMVGAMFAPMLAGTTIAVEQWVGLNDGHLHKFVLDVALNIDASLIDPEIGKITGKVYFGIELANINQGFSMALPTSYRPMSELDAALGGELEDLSGLGGSLFGGN